MDNYDPEYDGDRDRDPDDPKREDKAIAPAPAGGALTAATKLGKMLSQVNVASVIGYSLGRPTLLFHSRDGGDYTYGRTKTVIELGSRWAINSLTFEWGWVRFDNDNKPTEVLVPIDQPMPARAELPDPGLDWQPQMAVGMKGLDGLDAGVEATFKSNT